MSTDDGFEKSDPAGALEENNNTAKGDSADELASGLSSGATANETIIILASKDSYWAELEVEYGWLPNGRQFFAKTLRYKALSNGQDKGNIHFGIDSEGAGSDVWREILHDGAIQDGEWHPIEEEFSVEGNTSHGRIFFSFIYDRDNVGDVDLQEIQRVNFRPAIPKIDPLDTVMAQQFRITGSNGIPGLSHGIRIYNISNEYITAGEYGIGDSWSADIEMPTGLETLTFYAKQVIGGAVSEKSNVVTVKLILTTLDSPANNALLPNKVEFCGTGSPGVKVRVVKADNHASALTDTVEVTSGKSWTAKAIVDLPNGDTSVKAEYQLSDGTKGYTLSRTFRVVAAPVITASTTDQPMSFTVSGTNGLQGGKVEVFIDPGTRKVGEGDIGSDGSWSAGVTMQDPGSINLAAEQIVSGVRSRRGDARAFKIKPDALTPISVNYPGNDTVRFSGTGYATGKVEIHIDKNTSSVVDTTVSNGGSWTVDWPDQPPKALQMYARQSVPDGAGTGGRIYSEWTNITVTIPVPVPTLTAREGTDRKPEFSGTGHKWPETQVEVQSDEAPAPYVSPATVSNGRWSSTATQAWNPGTYNIQARQLFDGMQSAWTTKVELVIRAPLPTVTVTTNGLRPGFSGTCLSGAEVNLGFTGDTGRPHRATVTAAAWAFTRAQDFMPGSYTVRVTQSIGGQTSDVASASFDVPVLQPIIASPEEGEEVDHNPVIRGTAGVPGAVMEVFDNLTDKLLGSVDVTGDAWSMTLKDYPFGLHTVYAIQQYGVLSSVKSETRSFKVILFHPTISNPKPGEVIGRSFRLDGYARELLNAHSARVELWLKDATEPFISLAVKHDGYWWEDDAKLPLGPDAVRAKQFFGGEASAFGPEHAFTVVPSVPLIESPELLQHIGPTVTISGHGYAGDQVEVAGSDAPETLLGTTQVQANGTWSLELHIDKPAGPYSLIVQQECEGYRSGWSAPHPVTLLSSAPTFTAPEAGRWVTGTPRFEGTGETGKTIEVSQWFDSRKIVTQDNPVTSGAWTASPAVSLAPGPHWMKARQGGSYSGDSNRFEVMPDEDNSGDDR